MSETKAPKKLVPKGFIKVFLPSQESRQSYDNGKSLKMHMTFWLCALQFLKNIWNVMYEIFVYVQNNFKFVNTSFKN